MGTSLNWEKSRDPWITRKTVRLMVHTEKYFWNIIKSNRIRLYLPFSNWFETANGQCPFAVPNQSVHGKYNLISVWFNKIWKRFLCVYTDIGLLTDAPNLIWLRHYSQATNDAFCLCLWHRKWCKWIQFGIKMNFNNPIQRRKY